MLKAILIDDDELSLQFLQHALFAHSELVEVIGSYTDVHEALEAVSRIPVDLVMLDIEMPEISGLDLAQELTSRRENLSIVFVTAHAQYALEAFRANAVDYVVKPYTPGEIARVLLKIQNRLRLFATDVQRPLIESKPNRIQTSGCLAIYAGGSTQPIRLTETIAELFTYLICHRETRISKWVLCELFWPDQDPDQSMHSLYTAVYRLKKMLKDSAFPFDLLSHHGFYQVALWDCHVDFEAVKKLAALDQPVTEAQVSVYESVIAEFPSTFLEVHDFGWALPFTERIENDYKKIGLRLLQRYRANRQFPEATALCNRLEKRFPYDDDVQSAILQILADQEEDAQVKAQYEKYRKRLLQDLGSTPSVQFIRSFYQMLGQ